MVLSLVGTNRVFVLSLSGRERRNCFEEKKKRKKHKQIDDLCADYKMNNEHKQDRILSLSFPSSRGRIQRLCLRLSEGLEAHLVLPSLASASHDHSAVDPVTDEFPERKKERETEREESELLMINYEQRWKRHKYQESMVHTQLFVSFIDRLRKEQEVLDVVR